MKSVKSQPPRPSCSERSRASDSLGWPASRLYVGSRGQPSRSRRLHDDRRGCRGGARADRQLDHDPDRTGRVRRVGDRPRPTESDSRRNDSACAWSRRIPLGFADGCRLGQDNPPDERNHVLRAGRVRSDHRARPRRGTGTGRFRDHHRRHVLGGWLLDRREPRPGSQHRDRLAHGERHDPGKPPHLRWGAAARPSAGDPKMPSWSRSAATW